jgi:hypothetical protein
MYKSIKYIIIFIIILFIFIIINYFIDCGLKIRNNIDKFSNKYYSDFDIDIDLNEVNENKDFSCNNFYSNNSFCTNDTNISTNNNSVCNCNFQKDDLRYLFDSPETCCNRLCRKYSPEKCINTKPFLTEKYYCRDGNKCVENKGIILNSRISSNTCGNDPLNNQLLLPYSSIDECEKSITICDKHNIKERSSRINRQECLKDNNCGYCSNNTGEGLCIMGTASGPLDLEKYFYCTPQKVSKKYSYTYGDQMDFILQS